MHPYPIITSLLCLLSLTSAAPMLGENSYMNPYAMRYMPVGFSTCRDFFHDCHHTYAWEETVDRKRVITESCWPYATEEMRKFKNDPDFRCNKRIYDGLLARTWPEVSDETYARYAPGQQNS